MESGTVSKWLIGEGDLVENTQLFVEIETHTLLEERSADPMTMEIESHDEGYIAKILVSAGTSKCSVPAYAASLSLSPSPSPSPSLLPSLSPLGWLASIVSGVVLRGLHVSQSHSKCDGLCAL